MFGSKDSSVGGWFGSRGFASTHREVEERADRFDNTNTNRNSFTSSRDFDEPNLLTCQTAEDCGSNHICKDGQCVPANSTNTAGGGGGGGGGQAANTDCGDTSDATQDCPTKNCKPGPICGDGAEPFNCCGDNIYRCHGSQTPQCEPCEPLDKECNDFCDMWFRSNGTQAPGCDDDSVCGDCTRCVGSICKENTFNPPCWCEPGNSGCADCEKCDSDGECRLSKGTCNVECNCFVTCPCGSRYQGFHSQDNFATGPACPSACRAKTYQKYCVDGAAQSCPPQKDPMKEDPGNKCEEKCYGTTQKVSCNQSYTCPDGARCQQTGVLFAATGPDGECQDGADPSDLWSQGGKTFFVRVCKMSNDPSCEECDCNCENDCPDCYTCGADGKCVYDDACDDPCPNPCGGACCDEGQGCEPGVIWHILDACHFAGGDIVVPASVGLSLVHTADIPAESAVCGRFHTHCAIIGSNGINYGTHLDCQKGLQRGGSAGYKVCS